MVFEKGMIQKKFARQRVEVRRG